MKISSLQTCSRAKLNRMLAAWGIEKSLTTRPEEWPYIGRKILKRKRDDEKESEIHIRGEQVQPEKVKKKMYREAYVPTRDMIANGKMGINSLQDSELINLKCRHRKPQRVF